MSIFKEDRSTLNEAASNLDTDLSGTGFDTALQKARSEERRVGKECRL